MLHCIKRPRARLYGLFLYTRLGARSFADYKGAEAARVSARGFNGTARRLKVSELLQEPIGEKESERRSLIRVEL